LDSAVDMLKTVLAEGEQPRSYIEEQARYEGLGWRTVQTAAFEEVGVLTERHAPPEGGRAVSWWRLPDCATSATPRFAQSARGETAGQSGKDADCATKSEAQIEVAQSDEGLENPSGSDSVPNRFIDPAAGGDGLGDFPTTHAEQLLNDELGAIVVEIVDHDTEPEPEPVEEPDVDPLDWLDRQQPGGPYREPG